MKFFKDLLKRTKTINTKLEYQNSNIRKIVTELQRCQVALYVAGDAKDLIQYRNDLLNIEVMIEQAKFTAVKIEGITSRLLGTSSVLVQKVRKFASDDDIDLKDCVGMSPEEFVLLFARVETKPIDVIEENTFHDLYENCSGKKISSSEFKAEVSSLIDRRDGFYHLKSIGTF